MFLMHLCNHIATKIINWRDVHRKNVVNNVDTSSLRAPWQNGPYTEKHTEQHKKHVEHQDATEIQKHFLCVFYNLITTIQCKTENRR